MTAYRFGRFEIRSGERQLLMDGKPAPLGARAFDVLLALVERRDGVVGKNELLDLVWPGLVVEENNLQVQISTLRKLLGPQAIATIPGRGYRFTAALDGVMDAHRGTVGPLPTSAADAAEWSRGSHGNLPRELPPLYGRDDDLTALRALIDAHRLVTVVGAGGIGKSRLAQATARALATRREHGAWMIELAGLSDPALLPNAVAQALSVTLSGQSSALEELIAGLAKRNLLMVIDNCEHLLDAVASLAQAFIQHAPGVTLLATSQEPLRLPNEQQYRLVPLAIPTEATARGARECGAVALFEARVQAADPRFALNDENMEFVIDICRRLDGLPLAIELAAARVATLGLRPVRDKLDARFKLLTGGSRATLRRHQTLRATLEWSHGLLNDAEQTVFRRLGVFAGGFTIDLAQAVVGDARLDEWAVLDHLSALVDKSLVVVDAGDVPRYRLLESTRAFALEQLAAGETADTLRRHALAMLDFLERVDGANLDGELRTDQYAALVIPELDNLRAAYFWAIGEGGDVRVAIGLAAHAGSLIDYAVECADWLIAMRQPVEDGAAQPGAAARYWRALAAGNMAGRLPLPLRRVAADRAGSLYRELGEPRRVFSSLMRRVSLRERDGDAGAQAALDEARSLIRLDWPPEFRIQLLRMDASIARGAGRFSEALALNRDEVRASAATGDWRLEVIARTNLTDLLWEIGPIEEAGCEARKVAEELCVRPAAQSDMDVLYANLMGILSEMGSVDEAASAARTALPLMRRTQKFYLEEWVHLFWRLGQGTTAALLLGASDAQRARAGEDMQPNEKRLIAQARAALAGELQPEAFAAALDAGAALSDAEFAALLEEGLAQPRDPGSR